MNVFSVGDGIPYELTRENYMEKTHKIFPFYQNPQKYKNPYFAICPECNNPIQIINLLGIRYEEENTRRTKMHGRHVRRSIDGLADYNEENYQNCILHNPVAFRIVEIRRNEVVNEEIKRLVNKNRKRIASDIREITGILLTNDRINGIIDAYIAAGDYCYTHTNKYNIPYSILYTRESINLINQKVASSIIGERIKNSINEKSKWFKVESGQIKKNESIKEFILLNLLVINHRIDRGRQYITIKIEERRKDSDKIYNVFSEEIEMRQCLYSK